MKTFKNNTTTTQLAILLIVVLISKLFVPKKITIIVFLVLSIFVIFSIFKNRINLKSKHKIIFLILFFALVIRLAFPLTHTLLLDDFWIMEQSKNFILRFEPINCRYSVNLEESCGQLKPSGYPIILSAPFITFGLNNYIAIIFNIGLSILIIYLVYIFVLEFTNSTKKALITAILIAFSSKFLITSNHVDSVIPAITFFLILAIFFLRFYKEENLSDNIIAITFFIMAAMTRIEYASFIVIIIFIYGKKYLKSVNKKELIMSFVTIIIIIGFTLQYSQELGDVKSITTNEFKLLQFIQNDNIQQINDNFGFVKPIFILVSLIAGLIVTYKKNKKSFFIIFAFIPLILFYLSFRSVHIKETIFILIIMSYFYIAELIVYLEEKTKQKNSSLKIKNISTIIIVVIGILFILQSFQLKRMIENDYFLNLDTEILNKLRNEIPNECFIISERASYITATNDNKVIQTGEMHTQKNKIKNYVENNKCILFFQNSFCYQDLNIIAYMNEDANKTRAKCSYMKRNYELTPIFSYENYGKEYVIYNITGIV